MTGYGFHYEHVWGSHLQPRVHRLCRCARDTLAMGRDLGDRVIGPRGIDYAYENWAQPGPNLRSGRLVGLAHKGAVVGGSRVSVVGYGKGVTGAAQPLGDGIVTQEKLRTLLAFGSELNDLDYKEYLDPSKAGQKDKVELVKDMAAMQSIPTGGFVVVGVDAYGVPSDKLGALVSADFDPANLFRIAANYLPTIQVRAATHEINGITVALIYAGPPDPPSVPILVKDGQYPVGKSGTKTVFAAGDVFVRRGTQSVRWTPADVGSVLKPWEDSIREDERRRATAYLDQVQTDERGRVIAHGALGTLTWRLASEEFDAAFLEAIRGDDQVALRKLFLTFGADAASIVRDGEQDELDLLLDRLIASLALTVAFAQKGWFEQGLDALVDVYRAAIDGTGNPIPSDSKANQKLMWRVAVGAAAVGGLAVRLRQLWAVRPLAMPRQALIAQIREPSWIRHAVTATAWAKLLYAEPSEDGADPREIGGPVVAVARQLVERIPALRPDTQVSRFELNKAPEVLDTVLDSLIQFDVFWCVMAVAASGRDNDQYPSFASFYAHRADPALELLITDADARAKLLADDADNLKDAMRKVVSVARHVSWQYRQWPGESESQVVLVYLTT